MNLWVCLSMLPSFTILQLDGQPGITLNPGAPQRSAGGFTQAPNGLMRMQAKTMTQLLSFRSAHFLKASIAIPLSRFIMVPGTGDSLRQ